MRLHACQRDGGEFPKILRQASMPAGARKSEVTVNGAPHGLAGTRAVQTARADVMGFGKAQLGS